MKKAESILATFGLIVLIAIAWTVSLNQKSDAEKQAESLKKANKYLADEVYVLAVPYLEEAIIYQTEQTYEIECLLKDSYTHIMDNESKYRTKYTDLLESEMDSPNPREEPFLEAAEYYLTNGKTGDAITILRTGAEKTGSETIREEYEKQRYAYSMAFNAYDEVTEIHNGAIMVCKEGKWGLASKEGSLVISCVYDKISNYDGKKVVIADSGVISAVNLHQNRLALLHDEALTFDYANKEIIMLKKDDGWHLANNTFTVIRENAYEDIRMMYNGGAPAKKNGKWGIVNTKEEWVLENKYDEIICDEIGRGLYNGLVFVKNGGNVSLLSYSKESGWEEKASGFDDAKPFNGGYAAVKKNGKWGYIDENGKEVIDYYYDDALSFGQHLAAVKVEDKWGYIDLKGQIVIPCEFEGAKSFSEGNAPVKTERGWKFINLTEYK